MTSERTTSDILLNLESLVQEHSNELKLLNFNLKLLLSKFNKTEAAALPTASVSKSVIPENKENKISSSVKEVTVKQKIKYQNGGPIPLAIVRILDQNNKEIKTTRTDPRGAWTLILSPGSYKIHIVKEPVLDKPKIDKLCDVIISNDKGSLVLPNCEV